MRLAPLFLLASSLLSTPLLAGCTGGDDDTSAPPSLDPPALAFTRAHGIVTAGATIDGTAGRFLADTGSPFLYLNQSDFPAEVDTAKSVTVDGAAPLEDVPIQVGQDLVSPDPAEPFAGILGCPALCGHRASWDYATASFTLDSAVPPPGTGATMKVPFSFEGGSLAVDSEGNFVPVPASRILVDVTVEGTPYTFVVDTGSSWSVLRGKIFGDLIDAGRAYLPGPELETVYGGGPSYFTRVASLRAGEVEADDLLMIAGDSGDAFLGALSEEVGHRVDGSLGGSFLGAFFVTIDYPNSTLELSPYDAGNGLVDAGHSTGIELAFDGGYSVASVIDGSDAAAHGVAVGDEITSIDGKDLGSVTVSQVETLLAGPVSSTRQVTFGKAQSKALSGKTVALEVKELLPLP